MATFLTDQGKCHVSHNGKSRERIPPNHMCLLDNSYHITGERMKVQTYDYFGTNDDLSIDNLFHECNSESLRTYQRNKTDQDHNENQTTIGTRNVDSDSLYFVILSNDEKVVRNYSYLANRNLRVNNTQGSTRTENKNMDKIADINKYRDIVNRNTSVKVPTGTVPHVVDNKDQRITVLPFHESRFNSKIDTGESR